MTAAGRSRSPTKAWKRALELTAPIVKHPDRILPTVIEDLAQKLGEAPALLSDDERLTYRSLAERSTRYARWALDSGVRRGDVVCLLMPNRPEYMAIWLGITRVGGVVGLLNTHLAGPSLAHCINIAAPAHLIVAAELIDPLTAALPDVNGRAGQAGRMTIWVHGVDHSEFPRVDREDDRHNGEPLRLADRRAPTIEDRALLLYTSGTTGWPKAACISHGRLMQWSYWFAGLTGVEAGDQMYNCLPMYHSVGGVVATGAVLVGGGAVVIRDGFSASQFWKDVIRWDCTLFQYIGELCRYLLHAEPHPKEHEHRIRMCCGNGLRADVWDAFKDRFRIPQILEFYAATESTVSLFNVEGKPGAVGRVPSFLPQRSAPTLVAFDVEACEPLRNDQGFCVRCRLNEVGEALGPILHDPPNFGGRFEGYTSEEASEKKILRNVFEPGDAWFRTGDLMRQDDQGYFYFVDRIGDTFRWKGENVSTSEVSHAISAFPGVMQAMVYGVAVPGTDGRVGMATLVTREAMDLAAFRRHLVGRLPEYARPRMVRLHSGLAMTATLKDTKTDLARQGFDPRATSDGIYFNDLERQAFVRLDTALYDRIHAGQVRL